MKIIRASYVAIKKKYDKIGKGKVRLTQSSLILIRPILATTTTYNFPVLETDQGGNPLPDEIRLNQNDEFISYEVGYYVSATGTASGSLLKSPIWLTYAMTELSNKFVQLGNAWYGTLAILVNKISRLERWDLKKHNYVPRTQFKDSSVGLPYATQPNVDYSDHGTFPMQPMLTLSGAKKNDISIALVKAIDLSSVIDWTLPDASQVNIAADRLVLVFRGMLAQNAASFQK